MRNPDGTLIGFNNRRRIPSDDSDDEVWSDEEIPNDEEWMW